MIIHKVHSYTVESSKRHFISWDYTLNVHKALVADQLRIMIIMGTFYKKCTYILMVFATLVNYKAD
jgi:hypothetical protein